MPTGVWYLPGTGASVGPCTFMDVDGNGDSYIFNTKDDARAECLLQGCSGLAAAADLSPPYFPGDPTRNELCAWGWADDRDEQVMYMAIGTAYCGNTPYGTGLMERSTNGAGGAYCVGCPSLHICPSPPPLPPSPPAPPPLGPCGDGNTIDLTTGVNTDWRFTPDVDAYGTRGDIDLDSVTPSASYAHPSWAVPPVGNWIGASTMACGVFSLDFTLSEADFHSPYVAVSVQWAADNALMWAFVNDREYFVNRVGFESLGSYTMTEGFRSGANRLRIHYYNGNNPSTWATGDSACLTDNPGGIYFTGVIASHCPPSTPPMPSQPPLLPPPMPPSPPPHPPLPFDYPFTCVDVSATISTNLKFGGAAAAPNGLVVFAPSYADCVGTFDAATSAFDCIDITATMSSGGYKFYGATTAPNGLVVFSPNDANCVGTFDPATNAFNCISISVSGNGKFWSVATAPNGLVVFAPVQPDCVGTFDAATSTFDCIDISATLSGAGKFHGAAVAPNGLVVFAPSQAGCVGTFDAVTSAFDCVDISSTMGISGAFRGAAVAPNGLVVFAPRNANCVGTFNAATSTFNCVDSTATKFWGAATAPNGLVVFAPQSGDCVGTFDAVASNYSCIDIGPSTFGFIGAAVAPNGLVVLAPRQANCVGTFSAIAPPPSPPLLPPAAPPLLPPRRCLSCRRARPTPPYPPLAFDYPFTCPSVTETMSPNNAFTDAAVAGNGLVVLLRVTLTASGHSMQRRARSAASTRGCLA